MPRALHALLVVLPLTSHVLAADPIPPTPITLPPAWLEPPPALPAPGFESEKDVKAIFFTGPPYKGKPTQVFAWIGTPDNTPANAKLPGIVLVHGGGGTAFAEWVRLWTSRGYVAIAMDTCGQLPKGAYAKWERNPDGGPPGWGGFDQIDDPLEDQWPYHAVADVILAHSLLRSLPNVDPDRTGITGISWGGYLTCIVAGLDSRLKFAAPVYGCGYLGENSKWKSHLDSMGARGQRWLATWDPKHYLPNARMPMLWVTGTNDAAYPLDSLQKSYRTASHATHTLSIRLRMPHGHGGAGENPAEILAFANSIVAGSPKLPKPGPLHLDPAAATCSAPFTPTDNPASAQVLYTTSDDPSWEKREWHALPAQIDPATHRIHAPLPADARVLYLNLTTPQGHTLSTEHLELPN